LKKSIELCTSSLPGRPGARGRGRELVSIEQNLKGKAPAAGEREGGNILPSRAFSLRGIG
jgi:hypothetical protein